MKLAEEEYVALKNNGFGKLNPILLVIAKLRPA
jgi:hypothetical protein